MNWTLADLKSKIRKITGRPSSGQLSDADLLDHINHFLVNILPQEVPDSPAFKTWFTLAVASGDAGAYTLASTIQRVLPGNWTCVDDDDAVFPVSLYLDYGRFFELYPDDYDTTGRPDSVLLYNNTVYVRPIPDDSYTIKFPALGANVALLDDTDTLEDNTWAPLICYGAAIDILTDSGEHEEVGKLVSMYHFSLNNITRKNILSQPVGKRAAPSF